MKNLAICALLSCTFASKMDLGDLTSEADEVFIQYQEEQTGAPADTMLLQQSESESSSSSSSSSSSDDEAPQSLNQHRRAYYPGSFSQVRKVAETADNWEGFHASHSGFVGNNNNGGQWMDSYTR